MEENDQKFQYMMLCRLKSDCEYFLGYGNRSNNSLWAKKNPKDHITEMKRLWDELEIKPEWLSMEQIEEYESEMIE